MINLNKSFASLLLLSTMFLLSCDGQVNVISVNSVSSSTTTEDQAPSDFFGTLIALDPGSGFNGNKDLGSTFQEKGWTSFRSNKEYYSEYLKKLAENLNRDAEFVKKAGFSTDREIVGAFVWNVIEPQKGTYDWNLTDEVVTGENKAGTSLSAVVWPFAAWDRDSTPENCTAFDFAFYDYKADTPTDWEAYKKFLTAAVERYDGDGVSDMDGLSVPVKTWEIGNEFDGSCGGDLNEAENLYELQKISYETIKAADPDAVVLNAGALELDSNMRDIKGFWEKFFELGGGNYIDIFNMHFNRAKGGVSAQVNTNYEEELKFFNELMQKNGVEKPIWITEFGTYSGTIQAPKNLDGKEGPSMPKQSEDFQAAWYFEASVFALSNHVEKIFIDFRGGGSGIGSSSLYDQKNEARPFVTTLKVIEAKLKDFTRVEKIAEGQYLFTVKGEKVYALWSGNIPKALKGTVKVTNMYGQSKTMNASKIEISNKTPIFVELQ